MDYIIDSFLNVRISDVLDMAIVAVLIYQLIVYIRRTRAMQLLKGLIIIALTWALAELFSFSVLRFMIRNLMTLGIIFLVIVFQPELRLGLEKLGRRGNFVSPGFGLPKLGDVDKMIAELLKAVKDMSATKTGAIIVIEREATLEDIIATGEKINAATSMALIKNIFFKNAPLHDGAMIIRDSLIVAAGCLLPLSRNQSISKDLGTRHRAALGISERSDALVVVVSEETGTVSVCIDGKLVRFVDMPGLESLLNSKLVSKKKTGSSVFSFFNLFTRDKQGEANERK